MNINILTLYTYSLVLFLSQLKSEQMGLHFLDDLRSPTIFVKPLVLESTRAFFKIISLFYSQLEVIKSASLKYN